MFALRLRECRQKRRLTVRELALLARVSPSTISRIENGEEIPSVFVYYKLCRALGIDPTNELLVCI